MSQSKLIEANLNAERGFSLLKTGEYAKAFDYLDKASKLGNFDAKLELANLYDEGKGVGRNVEKAIELLKECLKYKNGGSVVDIASHNLGLIYMNCSRYDLAIPCLELSVKRGYVFSRLFLAECYFYMLEYERSAWELGKFLNKRNEYSKPFRRRADILKFKLSNVNN